MKKFNSKSLIALACIIISVVWIYLGVTKYGLWDPKTGPMSGFFPTIVGGVLLLASVIYFIKSFSLGSTTYDKPALYLMIALVVIYVASMIFGFLPTLLVFYIFWLKVMEKLPLKTIVISTVVVSAIVYGVFSVWLGVPFPEGLLLETILG